MMDVADAALSRSDLSRDVNGATATRSTEIVPILDDASDEAISSTARQDPEILLSLSERAIRPNPIGRAFEYTACRRIETFANYGLKVGGAFHLSAAPARTTTTLRTAQLAVTRLSSFTNGIGTTKPFERENAYIINLHLSNLADSEMREGPRVLYRGPLQKGTITISHLAGEPQFRIPCSFDLLQFYLPEVAFEELATDYGARRIAELKLASPTLDDCMHQLGLLMPLTLDDPYNQRRLFFEYVMFAVYSHVALQYGSMGEPLNRKGARLSPRQERLAIDLLTADLSAEPSILDIARACGLPVQHFLRAFRATTGSPPHRWLRRHRIDQAKALLTDIAIPIAQIAYDCGFADQSHFTKVFFSTVGVTPGAWRRARIG